MKQNTKQNLKTTFPWPGLGRPASGRLIALTLFFLGLPCLLPAQTLEHRYSFINTNAGYGVALDSVGGANGTIVAPNGGGAATINNGLNLPGNPGGGNGVSGYVSLPDGIVKGDTSVSVEIWVTANAENTWAEIWDFGSSGSLNFALIQDSPGPGNMRVAFTPGGNEIDINAPTYLPTGGTNYVAVTYNNPTLTGNLYLNGALDASTVFPNSSYSPGGFGDGNGTVEDTLGNDVYGDPQFGGVIYELRIWNGALSERYIAASALLGPGVLLTNLTPTTVGVSAPSVVVTGTAQAAATVELSATGTNILAATSDVTNWTSGNTNILTVNSSGVITGVGAGSTTVSATVGGVIGTSSSITVTPQVLEHRYSFATDASDSINYPNGANGTPIGPNGGTPVSFANGLILPGGGGGGYSGYVALPGGILTNTTSLTVECWLTQNQGNGWAEVWDFGNNGNQNFALIPDPVNNNGNMEVAFNPNNNDIYTASGVSFPSGSEQYVCLTYNNSSLVGNLYTNGALVATQAYPGTNYCPGGIGGAGGTTENWLGNDVYNDAQFQGTIYEFRIWNGAVSPLYTAVSAAAGSTVVVTNTTASALAVSVPNTTMIQGTTQQAVATGTFPQAAASLPGTLAVWHSSNTNVLTVNNSGVVTAVGSGNTSATVSATFQGFTAYSQLITISLTSPQITQEPAPLTLNVSDTAVFTVSAVGGSLNYQWYFGTNAISGATNSSLTLTDISLTNQGSYTVKVYNSIGTNYSTAVTLSDAPALVHRFSFNSLNDEVGTATATLVGGAYQDGAGNVQLPDEDGTSGNANQTYIQLSPGILTNSASMSIEVWATDTGSEQWAELVSIGGSDSLANSDEQGQTNYIGIIPHSGNGNQNMLAAFKSSINNEQDVEGPNNDPLPTGVPEYIVLTYDAQQTTAILYLNGVQVGINTNITVTPSSLGNSYDNFIGSDEYGGDPNFVGSVAEFRTWTGPVSLLYQALTLAAGSGTVITNTTPLSLSVTVTNGTLLEGVSQQAVVSGTFPQVTAAFPASLVTWTSSNTNYITVSSSGLVTAVGPGGTSATVSATLDGITATSIPITNAVVHPAITQAPTSQSAYAGQTITFAVGATGGALTYKWYFDATQIPGATSDTLVLADLTLSEAGTYSVTVANTAGSTNASVTLSVSEPSLNHRFSFNGTGGAGTVVNDSIGNATATLEGNSYLSGGAVHLPDTSTTSSSPNASYVLLSSGLLVNDTSATIEVWVTDNGGREWAEVYSFGGSDVAYDNAENGTNYIALIPDNPSPVMVGAFHAGTTPEADVDAAFPLPLNVEEDVALVYDDSTATASMYLNGNLVAQRANMTVNGPVSPATLGDTFDNYLGRDQFGGDPIFQGSISELRIYDGPLSPVDIANDYISGPTSLTSPGSPNRVSAGISLSNGHVVITWPVGTLLQAPTVLGPWTTNSAATSPYTVPAGGTAEFYRIQVYP